MRKVFSSERLMVLWLALTLGLYRLQSLPLRKPLQLYFERLTQALVLYLFAILLTLLFFRLKDLQLALEDGIGRDWSETKRKWKIRFLSPKALIADFRYLNVFALTFVLFIQLKHLTPFLREYQFDQLLFHWEQQWFGGTLLSIRVQQLFGYESALWLSEAYMFFYPYMAVLTLFMLLQPNELHRERFALAFALLWLMGALAIYVFPTLGPCFYDPSSIALLPDTPVADMQRDLWKHREFVLAHPQSPEGVFLIAGFPSLHLAVPCLGMLFSFRSHQLTFILSAATATVTLFATLYFGWHYLLDDLGSILLAALAFGLAKRWACIPGR